MLKMNLVEQLKIAYPECVRIAVLVVMSCLFVFYSPVSIAQNNGQEDEQAPLGPPPVQRLNDKVVIIYAEADIQEYIAILTPQFRKVGRFTQVQAQIQNFADVPFDLEYKVTWMSQDGFEFGGAVAWNMLHLTANDVQALLSTGKHPDAVQIKITLRYHRPS